MVIPNIREKRKRGAASSAGVSSEAGKEI